MLELEEERSIAPRLRPAQPLEEELGPQEVEGEQVLELVEAAAAGFVAVVVWLRVSQAFRVATQYVSSTRSCFCKRIRKLSI